MAFSLVWDVEAAERYKELEDKARKSYERRVASHKIKASQDEKLGSSLFRVDFRGLYGSILPAFWNRNRFEGESLSLLIGQVR